MKIKLTWVEKKHIDSLGKDLLECNGNDEQGNPLKFTVWSDFPGFNDINAASEIEGNLWEKPGTGKFTLYPPKAPTNAKSGATGGVKDTIKEAQEVKRTDIKNAQENKELGIKISSTMRMAVDITLAEISEAKMFDEGVVKSKIKKWREWLWMNWEAKDDDFPPFE